MGRVTIGLNEKGYNPNNGEFDDYTIRNVSEVDVELDPNDGHGNAMAGIICSDNDETGRFLNCGIPGPAVRKSPGGIWR